MANVLFVLSRTSPHNMWYVACEDTASCIAFDLHFKVAPLDAPLDAGSLGALELPSRVVWIVAPGCEDPAASSTFLTTAAANLCRTAACGTSPSRSPAANTQAPAALTPARLRTPLCAAGAGARFTRPSCSTRRRGIRPPSGRWAVRSVCVGQAAPAAGGLPSAGWAVRWIL
eukprot:361432-Chlamydomonas_euryale.AAC.10